MNLPEGWRLGRPTKGYQTLFYQDSWVERLELNRVDTETIAKIISNPPARIYPELFKAGCLDSIDYANEQGVRNLVKAGLVSATEAVQLCPQIKKWLQRNNFLGPKEETYVIYNGMKYTKAGDSWTVNGVEIQKPAHFKSIWAARVAFAKGECSLRDVAEYSWGAVLEVIGDQVQLLPDYSEKTRLEFQNAVYFQIMQLLNAPAEVGGFRQNDLGLWYAIPRIVDLRKDTAKLRKFFSLLWRVMNLEISGYCARLTFTNANYVKINFERARWDLNDHAVYIPYFVKRNDKIDAKASLEDARNYVQAAYLDMIAIGALPEQVDTAFFVYKHNTYGVRLQSGKLFSIVTEDSKYIPKDFDKWSEEKQRAYLEDDYDKLVEDWCQRTRANRKLYFYLRSCLHVSSRKAWLIASAKHRKLGVDFLKRRKAACRWACMHANQSAQPGKIYAPMLRLEAV